MVKLLKIGRKIAENRGATMSRRSRRNHSSAFKVKVAKAAVRAAVEAAPAPRYRSCAVR